jgi:hypothetical protein
MTNTQQHLSNEQVTAAALAAVVRFPAWAANIGKMTNAEIDTQLEAYFHNMRLASEDQTHHGIVFLRWLQAELQHELNLRDIRYILLTIKQAFYT